MHTYNDAVAFHYAAYRPPLHSIILEKALSGQSFEFGLDIGCGTGVSTVALSAYCKSVLGVEHSPAMLDQVEQHPKIRYELGRGECIPLNENSVDIISPAGVVPYLDRAESLIEMRRVSKKDALFISYDFRVILDPLLELFSIDAETSDKTYDHSQDFTDMPEVYVLRKERALTDFPVTAENAAHLLLSNAERARILAKHY